MNISKKKVLVTGAGGFIGSHLVEMLVEQGASVRAFVRYNSRSDNGMIENLPKKVQNSMEIVAGDLRDHDAVHNAVKDMDAVFHLGALVGIPYSYIHPLETVETNVLGTMNVLLASRDHGVERVVHTSTSETFGSAQYVPIDDKHPVNPQSPYAASKAGADFLALSFHRAYDLPVSVLRPFNTYGPRQSMRAIVPTIMVQALTRPYIKLGSLTPTRDLTFVRDTADAFIKACESERSIDRITNVGACKEIAIGDLAEKILSILGISKEIIVEDNRVRPEKSEVNRLMVDNSMAKEILGWEPKTDLNRGISLTADWIKNNLESYKPELYVV